MKKLHRLEFKIEAAQSRAMYALQAATITPVGERKRQHVVEVNAALNRRDALIARRTRQETHTHVMELRRLRMNQRNGTM